jgi:A/G-specific adenine glycosylase
MISTLSAKLLLWYQENHRQLPWRDNPDPYWVWISEVMLQQTKVETVIPYFLRWMERFPDLASLAAAPLEEVLRYWEGLGYYARARNLHRAAQRIMEKYSGNLPQDIEELRRLPGIGSYSAAAIASIAFRKDTPTLDGNIRRVLARLEGLQMLLRSRQAEQRLIAIANQHLPPGQAGEYNQALMELGALICTPRTPRCDICPLSGECVARRQMLQNEIPAKFRKPPLPHLIVTAAVICRNGSVLIAQRPAHGLLGSLWEFPGGKIQEGETLEEGLQRELMEELGLPVHVGESLGIYHHAYTHFKITLHAFFCHPLNGHQPQPLEGQAFSWVEIGELHNYPMGKIDRLISLDLNKKDKTC